MRVDLTRALQQESEINDSQASANGPQPNITPGQLQFEVAGALPAADGSGDYFQLRYLNPGNVISARIDLPSFGSLIASDVQLSVERAGVSGALAASTTGHLNFTAVTDGFYYVRVVGLNDRSIRAQYLLTVTVNDAVAPVVTSDTLPAEGTTITSVYDRFNLGFSEDMAAATVNDPNNIEIRSAGPDGVFDSADDVFYHVASPGYSSGLSVGYRIADGPLQPGSYRVTLIDPGLTDRVGNPLAAPYVRTFAVAGVAPYILENRSNDSFATPTSLSTTPGTAPSGTFLYDWNGGVGNNPYDVATADLNADGKLDLVTANIGSNTVSIYLGNGDGTFGNRVDYATGSGPIAVSIGDVTGDGRLDLVVANEGTTTISVLAGNGDGTFAPRVDYAVGNNPYDVAIGDLNADGKLDVVAANINSNTVSVWRGKADGTLGSRVDYATGASPIAVKLADFDGDGKLDLVVANDGGNSVSVLKGLGDGTFGHESTMQPDPAPIPGTWWSPTSMAMASSTWQCPTTARAQWASCTAREMAPSPRSSSNRPAFRSHAAWWPETSTPTARSTWRWPVTTPII